MTVATPEADQQAVEDLAPLLNDTAWRLSNLYWIIVKQDDDDGDGDGLVMRFKPNPTQRRLMARMHTRNVICKARQLGMCLDPSTRVLTADLRWVPIADLQAGDRVVAVDEECAGGKGTTRYMRTADVQAVVHVEAPAYRITFDDGRSVVCTDWHPWLSRAPSQKHWQWRSIDPQPGQGSKKRLKVGTQVRWVTKPWADGDMDDGWFGGMLDGEGSMALPSRNGASVSVSQVDGPVWNRLCSYAMERGYNARVEHDAGARPSKFGSRPVPKLAFTRMDELFRLVGQTRPTRFIGREFWEGRALPGRRTGEGIGVATIVSIEPVGTQTMIDLQTSTGTYIAEGFVSHNTTLVAILWLDTALFSKAPIRCGIIAHEREAAESIFRDKVLFAYQRLPDQIKALCPIKSQNKTEIVFAHNDASIRVATSMRSGTIHRLHVSELGKISRKYPGKAREVIAGSIPTVPSSGIVIIESTAEGEDGVFHDIAMRAEQLRQKRVQLSRMDYKIHFFAWWEDPAYTLDDAHQTALFDEATLEYFNRIEMEIGRPLSEGQRAWYVATRDSALNGDEALMWQEYPATLPEAFRASTEGCYYTAQLTSARRQQRIRPIIPIETGVPVYSFWDLGRSDYTAIWLMQKVGPEHRFIWYYENSGEELDHYAKWLQDRGVLYARHYLPHDADIKRLGERADTNRTLKESLESLLPGHRVDVVPRVSNIMSGIQSTRSALASCWFHETNCVLGMSRLAGYRKTWDRLKGCWKDEPLHNEASHGADAFRQFGQVVDAGEKFGIGSSDVNRPLIKPVRALALGRPRLRGSGSMTA